MPALDLGINGRLYTVACDPGEEDRVRQLGTMLDQKARLLGQTPSDAQRFLMVALMLADELDETRSRSTPAAAADAPQEGLLVAAVDHLAERIDTIAAALAQA